MTVTLTNETYDGVCSILLGNGSVCTTIGPSGYHAPPDQMSDTAQRTQHFVWAGRRHNGARHSLRDFGSVSRTLHIDGGAAADREWTQRLDCRRGACTSSVHHGHVTEHTTTVVCLSANCALIETAVESVREADIVFDVVYVLPSETYRGHLPIVDAECVRARFVEPDNMGEIRMVSINTHGRSPNLTVSPTAVRFRHSGRVAPGNPLIIRTLIQFSDRLDYSFPLAISDWDSLLGDHERSWAAFWSRSDIRTANDTVDRARAISLYTIRAQLTDWSIGPTLSEPYWGGGAFHDEMYPFFALLSGNHADLASRMPRFRLNTLGAALQRGRGAGALYPWSSTESGQERDPDGLWLTERFHLAQFSAEIWSQWLYERDRRQLLELYPVLHEIARFFENTVVVADPCGLIGTRPCVDFDESVGAVRNGPFTVSGASSALRWAADAARILGIHGDSAQRWHELADKLRAAIVEHRTSAGETVFGIPDGVPVHYSILGHVFPFRTEVDSDRAVRSARVIHSICRSTRGWKPGLSSAFDGSNWQWTSGHLGIVHAMQGNASLAWEAILHGPDGSGPGRIPCEHLNAHGVPQVPWFTTGVGAWVYALHAAVSWVDERATHLFGGIPEDLRTLQFEGIRGSHGVVLSGGWDGDRLQVTASAPTDIERWPFAVPTRLLPRLRAAGDCVAMADTWVLYHADIPAGSSVTLINSQEPL